MKPIFTEKHYIAIAKILGRDMMDDNVIDAFIEALKKDNPKFKPTRFMRAVQKAAKGE